jgi:hypothetical protein
MASFPDYYDILHATRDASTEDIRQAYRRESLKLVYETPLDRRLVRHTFPPRTHPDRLFSASTAEKQAATERFQVSSPIALYRHSSDGVAIHLGCRRRILCTL